MIPALSAWTESPEPGISTSSTVSAMPITSTSLCPAPTVSRKSRSLPDGVEHEHRLQRRLGEPAEVAARAHRADEDAGVEEVVAEPDPVAEQRACVNGLDGSTEMTPTVCSRPRTWRTSALISDDLPTPGGPVTPTA